MADSQGGPRLYFLKSKNESLVKGKYKKIYGISTANNCFFPTKCSHKIPFTVQMYSVLMVYSLWKTRMWNKNFWIVN